MAKKFTVRDDQDLRHFDDYSFGQLKNHTFYLDCCAVEDAADKVLIIVGMGNFRISRVALNELKDWRNPGIFNPHKKDRWNKVQKIIKLIETKHSNCIDEVGPGKLFEELQLLESLLSKQIVFNLVMEKFDQIYRVLGREKVRLAEFRRGLKEEWSSIIFSKFEEQCKKQEHIFRIRNKEDYRGIAVNNMANSLRIILKFMQDMAQDRSNVRTDIARIRVQQAFKNKMHKDELIVEHYLLSTHGNKRLPAHDKDIFELAWLHRHMLFAA